MKLLICDNLFDLLFSSYLGKMASRIIFTEEEQNNRRIWLEEYTHYKINPAHALDYHLEHMNMMIVKLETTHLYLRDKEKIQYLQRSLLVGWAIEIQRYFRLSSRGR